MTGLVSAAAAPVEPERPKAVGVVGWVWLVLAVLAFIKAVVNLISWSVLQSASPRVFELATGGGTLDPVARWILRNATVVFTAQAFLWIFVIVAAVNFLRLRPWARTAIQVVCILGVVYAAGLILLWFTVWRRAAEENPQASLAPAVAGLIVGIVAAVSLATAFVVMLRALRRPRVLEAFGLVGPGGVEPPT